MSAKLAVAWQMRHGEVATWARQANAMRLAARGLRRGPYGRIEKLPEAK